MVGEDAGGDATDEATECSAADIEAHDERDALRRPFFSDVSDDDGDDAGDHNALQESPEDELRERSGSGGEQCWDGDAENREDDHAFACEALSQRAEDGCGDGHAERSGGNSHADAGFGGVKEMGEKRQERLRAVELKKGAHSTECDGGGGPPAGIVMAGELL